MDLEQYAEYVKSSWRLDPAIETLMQDETRLRAFLRLSYATGKLNGEAGEVIEEVQKSLRDDGGDITNRRDDMILELGDVLWYVFAIAGELGITVEEVMEANKKKLDERRKKRAKAGRK